MRAALCCHISQPFGAWGPASVRGDAGAVTVAILVTRPVGAYFLSAMRARITNIGQTFPPVAIVLALAVPAFAGFGAGPTLVAIFVRAAPIFETRSTALSNPAPRHDGRPHAAWV